MIIFGMNLPLPEILLLMVFGVLGSLVLILIQLTKLQKMTSEERNELEQLEKLALQEQKDLQEIKQYEGMEAMDLRKFEKEILTLEEDTNTLYLKRLAPNVYKLQNYTLWALKKGMSPTEIKEKLLHKGWKDNELVEMVIDDTLKYMRYFKDKGGKVDIPTVNVEETTKIIKPVKVVHLPAEEIKKEVPGKKLKQDKPKLVKSESQKPKKTKSKKAKKISKKLEKLPTDNLSDIEKELTKLEADLEMKSDPAKKVQKKTTKKSKKTSAKNPKKRAKKKTAATKKPAKKVKTTKKTTKKNKKAEGASVLLEADKDIDVHVKYK